MGMFDRYQNPDPNYIPDNRHRCFPCKTNNIVAGGSSVLIFELPAHYNDDLIRLTIVFNQEEKLIMVKNPSSVVVEGHHMFVECRLNPVETQEFGHTTLDTLVQLKLEYPNNRVLYTDIEKIKVLDTLDDASITPVLSGIGWTED